MSDPKHRAEQEAYLEQLGASSLVPLHLAPASRVSLHSLSPRPLFSQSAASKSPVT